MISSDAADTATASTFAAVAAAMHHF